MQCCVSGTLHIRIKSLNKSCCVGVDRQAIYQKNQSNNSLSSAQSKLRREGNNIQIFCAWTWWDWCIYTTVRQWILMQDNYSVSSWCIWKCNILNIANHVFQFWRWLSSFGLLTETFSSFSSGCTGWTAKSFTFNFNIEILQALFF